MRALLLTKAIIKGFLRNYKQLLLLLVFPFLVILVIVSAFNPLGLRKLPVGVVRGAAVTDSSLDVPFSGVAGNAFEVVDYGESLKNCWADVKRYKVYLCVYILPGNPYLLKVYFDDTREEVIWELLEKVKSVSEAVQKERSKEFAAGFLQSFRRVLSEMRSSRSQIAALSQELAAKSSDLSRATNELKSSKEEFYSMFVQMRIDVADARTELDGLKSAKDEFSYQASSFFQLADSAMNELFFPAYSLNASAPWESLNDNLNSLKTDFQSYDALADNYFANAYSKLDSYEEASLRGQQSLSNIDYQVQLLESLREEFLDYSQRAVAVEARLDSINEEFRNVEAADPETLVNPLVLKTFPLNKKEGDSEVKGDLQTTFPVILFLVMFLLSLIISAFVTTNELNSPAYSRKSLLGISASELVSIYLSSLIITFIPLLFVLLVGQWFFNFDWFSNALPSLFLILTVVTVLILTGMLLSYLLRRESVTLIVLTFLVVFMVFFSGFLLPVERMRPEIASIAEFLPGRAAFLAFKKLVFYKQGLFLRDVYLLAGWLAASLALLVAGFAFFKSRLNRS